MDLHEISLKLFTDSQNSPTRRRRAKKTVQTSADADTSIVEQSKRLTFSLEEKQTCEILCLDDEESLSLKDSAFISTRTMNNKQTEIVPEHLFTFSDSSPQKTKSKMLKIDLYRRIDVYVLLKKRTNYRRSVLSNSNVSVNDNVCVKKKSYVANEFYRGRNPSKVFKYILFQSLNN